MARPHSSRCAYFVEEPIANSFPKPQRSKSQVHNCSLNQSANFVVSVAANTWPGIVYSQGPAVHGMYLQSYKILLCPRAKSNQRRYIQLWACGLHTFYIKPSTTHPICSAFRGIIVFLWLRWRDGPHSSRPGSLSQRFPPIV